MTTTSETGYYTASFIFKEPCTKKMSVFSSHFVVLRRVGLASSRWELRRVVWSRGVLVHEGQSTGRVGWWGGTALLRPSRILQRLVRVARHSTRTVLLHGKALETKKRKNRMEGSWNDCFTMSQQAEVKSWTKVDKVNVGKELLPVNFSGVQCSSSNLVRNFN